MSGIAWRAELEWRGGWAGLTWITYFHWAIPVCGLAFVSWVVRVTRVQRPSTLAVSLVVFFSLSYVVFYQLNLHMSRWVVLPGLMQWMVWSIPVFWALLPLAFGLICRASGASVRISSMLASCVLFVLSWPLSIFVRSFFEERGSPDTVHALKSGFVIPFLIVVLGFPLLRRPSRV